ncbi:MAG: hypothetical protein HQ483_14720 [Rhodospirillales bacterium]|nr:hypothetical protein [Rhodospirillales bacterium]
MKDQTDLQDLAGKYMDLWQEHLLSVSKDEATAEILAQSMAMMNSGVATFANAMADAAQSDKTSDHPQPEPPSRHAETANPKTRSDPPARATTPALSSVDTDIDVDQLLGRIAALEKRVAQLEQTGKPGRESKVRSRKRTAD